jgi:hypothetical protein
MKNQIKFLSLVLFLFIGSQKVNAQQVASNDIQEIQINGLPTYNLSEEKVAKIESTILSEGSYTFNNGEKDVLVTIKNGYYTESYSQNEFIKAKIKWHSKNEYKLVVTEINKKDLPFKIGTELNTKIVEVKGNRYYYESELEGLTWTGKFRKN